jgi:hypothetical protein
MSAERIPFEPQDERAMASGATWARISAVVSVLSTLCGSLFALQAQAHIDPVDAVVEAVTLSITLLLGFWLFRAGMLFHRVATTDQADQRFLLEGFVKLRAYFRLVVILAIAALVVAGALLVLGTLS